MVTFYTVELYRTYELSMVEYNVTCDEHDKALREVNDAAKLLEQRKTEVATKEELLKKKEASDLGYVEWFIQLLFGHKK